MPFPTETQTVTFILSATVSDMFSVVGRAAVSVWAPTITSAQILFRGSFDTTSANFVPLYLQNGASRYAFSAGPGSVMVGLDQLVIEGIAYLKLESGVAQAASRFFVVSAKP